MSPAKLYTPHDVTCDIIYSEAGCGIHDNATAKQLYLGDKDENTRTMTIYDMRNREDEFTIDNNGFQVVKLEAKERNTIDEDVVKSEYYKEMEEVIKNVTGASTVHVFNHLIRAAIQSQDQRAFTRDPKLLGPAGQPHVDFTRVPKYLETLKSSSGVLSTHAHLFDTASRWQIIGTWRPIKTIKRDPLAVADATTVPDSDFSIRTRKYPNGQEGANYMLGHGSAEDQHKWYYLHEQQPDELLVLKQYDTNQDLPGWRCAHTGFRLPGTEDLPARESIEARAIAFF